MKLSELLSVGTATGVGMKKVPITWVDDDESGNKVERKFDVFIRNNISFAANDRIFGNAVQSDEDSRNSRIISELVRFGDGTEQITVEAAANLKPSLGWALVAAVLANMPKRVEAKKPAKGSRQQKKSGTN